MRRWLVGLLLLVVVLVGCRVEEGAPTAYPVRTPAARSTPAATRAISPSPARPTTPAAGEVAFTITVVHSGEVVGKVLPCG